MNRLRTTEAYRAAMEAHTGLPVPRHMVARYQGALLRAVKQSGKGREWPPWRPWRAPPRRNQP